MVKHLFLFLIFPLALFSAEFTATVNRNQVGLGDSLTLNLTLKDASLKEPPSLHSLKHDFIINSQQQFSNTTILNGQMTSSVSWRVVLLPQKEGSIIILPISITTSEGVLSSSPITIQVVKSSPSAGQDPSDVNVVTVATSVSKANPYKNEPIVYTVTLTTKKDIANIKLNKLEIEDAIVETNGEPKIYEKVIDGLHVGIVEFSHLITPLKAGTLTIPALVLQGAIPAKRSVSRGGFFDDDFNPFSMIGGLDQLKPFVKMTEEKVLHVQPPVPDVNPWLLAKSLTVEEVWNNPQELRVGEPLNRTFKIVAEGVSSSQLPSLNDFQMKDHHFKVYADKPELGEEIKEGNLKSHRSEQYTFIPQQSGTLTLPEISIAWWNTEKNEKEITRISQKSLEILPALENSYKSSKELPSQEVPVVKMVEDPSKDIFFYTIIAVLSGLLCFVMIWIGVLQRKIAKFTKTKKILVKKSATSDYSKFAPKKNKQEKLPDLNPS